MYGNSLEAGIDPWENILYFLHNHIISALMGACKNETEIKTEKFSYAGCRMLGASTKIYLRLLAKSCELYVDHRG